MRFGAIALSALLLSSCAGDPAVLEKAEQRRAEVAPILDCPANEPPLAMVAQNLLTRYGTALTQEKADPALSAAIIQAYNDTPPPSDVKAEFVAIFDRAGAPSVLVLLVSEKGCVVGGSELPREHLAIFRARTRS
jgi:hypothetical protein